VVWVGYALTQEERQALRAAGDVHYWGGASGGGSLRFLSPTSSRSQIMDAVEHVFTQRVDPERQVHRLSVTLDAVVDEDLSGVQLDLFQNTAELDRERRQLEAMSAVKGKFGKNALLYAYDLLPEATARERNEQIGGHRAGSGSEVPT
jgi:DNA polymerase V